MKEVMIGTRRVRIDPTRSIGKGGEADVYDIGGVALKVYKTPDHPDYRGLPEEQQAARDRLRIRGRKLRDFPAALPPRVVVPRDLATDRNGAVVGYTMALVPSAATLEGWRPPRAEAVTLFRALHGIVAALHARGIVIGDFNDLNVLVSGGEPHLIDADSFQFGPYLCEVFTERFVDPKLCGSALTLARPFNPDSDWYAFSVMLLQALLGVGPYEGVYRARRPQDQIPHAARPLHRITIFHPDVKLPKIALSSRVLPDDLARHFQSLFERDARGAFPPGLLEMTWTKCTSCGRDYARAACPDCRPMPVREMFRGKVRATPYRGALARPARRTWEEGGRLLREGPLGPEHIGDVLANQTRFWVGPEFGVGFYRAGALSMGFVFDAEKRGILDGVPLPLGSARLIEADCVFGASCAWLFLRVEAGPKRVHRCVLVKPDGRVAPIGEAVAGDGWLGTWGGRCAAGAFLFIATDDGLVRVSQDGSSRLFPETEPFVDASSRLFAGPDGIVVDDLLLTIS